MSKDLIASAIEWAENGIPVFPCGADKAPLTKHGFKDAVSDPSKVKALFEFYGEDAVMIGGAMGKRSGIIAVDVDLYKDGAAEWYDEQVENGTLTNTRIHKTKNGGLHLLYEADEFPTTLLHPAVDLKGEGGYVILPGSPGYTVERAGLERASDALIKAAKEAKRHANMAPSDQLEADILSAVAFHEPLTLLAARMAATGKGMAEIQGHLIRLMEASVASRAGHKRHHRWRKLMDSEEIPRAVASGYRKFNRDGNLERVYEDTDDEALDALDRIALEVFPDLYIKNEPVEPEYVAPNDDSWPYDGYEAHEDYDIADQEFHVYPIFAKTETVILYAEPKVGKTAIALALALNLSAGENWGEFQIPSWGPSLYFALEGTRAVRLRVAAWKKYMREQGKVLPETLPTFVVEGSPAFYKEDTQKRHAEMIAHHSKMCEKIYGQPLKVIVLDTLTKAMSGGDQNSAEDTAKLFDIIQLLRAKGITATIVFIHHKTKSVGTPRGSSNIEAEADVLLDVSKEGDLVSMKVARARSIEDGQVYHFRLEGIDLGKNKQGLPMAGVVPIPVNKGDVQENEYLTALMDLGTGSHGMREVIAVLYGEGAFDKMPREGSKVVEETLIGILGGKAWAGDKLSMALRYTNNKLSSLDVNVLG